jgi:low affinity Fe/Cu permease
MRPGKLSERQRGGETFRRFARRTSEAVGSPFAFGLAILSVVVWAALGPRYNYSDTWQLVINTATTIVTFLMVFAIQNTQNRDAKAIHLKLDELLRGVKGARTSLVRLEDLTDEQIGELQKEFERLRARAAIKDSRPRLDPTSEGQEAQTPAAP